MTRIPLLARAAKDTLLSRDTSQAVAADPKAAQLASDSLVAKDKPTDAERERELEEAAGGDVVVTEGQVKILGMDADEDERLAAERVRQQHDDSAELADGLLVLINLLYADPGSPLDSLAKV